MYDGTRSLFGFSKAFSIASHYLLSGNVKFQAPAASKNVEIFLTPSRPGSFDQGIAFFFDHMPEIITGTALTPIIFKDFIALAFNKAVGREFSPSSSAVNKIKASQSSDLDALSDALEGPLKDAHRTVLGQPNRVHVIGNGRNIVEFTSSSAQYLHDRIVEPQVSTLEVSIASYNVNSKSGRFYVFELGRTVSFEPAKNASIGDLSPISWSLDQRNRGMPGPILIKATKVIATNGDIKKLLLYGCQMSRQAG